MRVSGYSCRSGRGRSLTACPHRPAEGPGRSRTSPPPRRARMIGRSDDPRRGGRRRAYVAGDATGSARGWAAPATAELFEPPRSSALIRTAKTMARDHPDLAVITAQVAVEIFVERAFDALCRSHVSEDLAAAIVGCIPDRSLMSSETRALWEALIDQRLSKKTVPTRRLPQACRVA